MPNATEINRILKELTIEEKRSLIIWYRNYMVSVNCVDPELFGSDFDEKIDNAVQNGDKSGILRLGVKDVIGAIKDPDLSEEMVEIKRHFSQELGTELWSKLTTIGSEI